MNIPPEAVTIQLFKIVREQLIACDPVRFERGAAGVGVALRRAAISGHVAVGDNVIIRDYFADLHDANGSTVTNVALDAKSYRMLKNRWAKTKISKYS